jgi:hypothetical protein
MYKHRQKLIERCVLVKKIIIVCILLLISGCSNREETAKILYKRLIDEMLSIEEQFNVEIEQLKDTIAERDETIEELESKVTALTNQSRQHEGMLGDVARISLLLENLAEVTHQEGFISIVIDDDTGKYVMVDYATVVPIHETSPDDYRIENDTKEYVKVTFTDDIQLYLLNKDILQYASLDKFKKAVKKDRLLFNLYFVNEKLVLITEKYLR